jgi:prevent-host-death family protein
MKAISIREMRSELGHLDRLMDEEGEVIVTKHGKPIARLLPLKGARTMPSHAPLRAQMPILKTPSSRLLRKDRDER